ncbi:MAG: hypothetical protein FJ299_09320 [Planctomycetes bacterium]|nr:hypothetical protein [Planctomycetota bacterium]
MKIRSLIAAGFALAALAGHLLSAQGLPCPQPDGLQGPCCAPTAANLPAFPPLSLPSLGLCFNQCNPVQQPNMKVALGGAVPVSCGAYQAQLTVTNPAGAAVLSGMLRMDYTRTWVEVPPAPGPQYQVWRFVVKANLGTSAAVGGACPVPTCITAANPTTFFYGYADYAFDCLTGTWEGALVLYHGCDRFSHSPVSATPGVFHPGTSYAIVAPVSAANPFVPAAMPYGNGALVAEAVRDVSTVGGAIACKTEERISGGFHQQLGFACACPLSLANPMHSANLLQGVGSCPDSSGLPSSFQAINVPGQPWVFEIKSSIGNWLNPVGPYPGNESVWVDEGLFQYHDSCAPATATPDSINTFYGASTARGFNVLPTDPGILTDKFIDLASNFHLPVGSAAVLPATNLVLPTRYLIYVNIP